MRATDISSNWPARLSFRAACGGGSANVNTQLVGEHMVYSALAALAAAVLCGVPLQKAVDSLKQVQPVNGRMGPMYLPNGATVLRDDFNPSLATLEPALEVLRTAECRRRIVILGDVLDSGLSERPRLRHIASRAAACSDFALFLGGLAKPAAKAAVAAGMDPNCVRAIKQLPDAADFLRSELREGDLVLIHDWMGRHIERVVLAQLGSISCWRERCQKVMLCDDCSELNLVTIRNTTESEEPDFVRHRRNLSQEDA